MRMDSDDVSLDHRSAVDAVGGWSEEFFDDCRRLQKLAADVD